MTLDHATRRTGIGGSDIPALLGLSRFKTPMDVYLQKLQLVPPSSGDTGPQEWGHRLEPVILQALAERHGLTYHPAPGTVRASQVWEHALYTPDGVGDGFVAEAKNRSVFTADGWGPDGGAVIPEDVLAQVQWGMLCLDQPVAYVGALIGGNDFRSYVIAANPAYQQRCLEVAQRFWTTHIIPEVPPPLDGSDASDTYLKVAYPRVDLNTVEVVDDADAYPAILLKRALQMRTQLRTIEDEYQRLQQQLKESIGVKAGFTTSFGTVTWTEVKGKPATDWEALAKWLGATPEQIAEHTERKPGYRRLTLRDG